MPLRKSDVLRLLDQLEGPIAKGFYDAVAAILDRARINALIVAIEANDLDAAMQAVGFRAGTWSTLTESIRNGYLGSGVFVMSATVPKRFGATFDLTNPRAEAWLRQNSSQLITLINADQRDSVQTILQAGMRAGRNPRNVALDIVGRIGPTGRRTGGVLGLNGPQTNAVVKARTELQNLDSNYFTRTRRDKRFDSTVRKAIESGKPLDSATVDILTGRYSDRLLKLRGDTIGRTEALTALNSASDEALKQIVQEGLAPPDAVKRIWRHSYSKNERPGHLAMSGQERGLNEPFQNPLTGASLQYPGDGPASESINCRCWVEQKIDFIKVELAA